ncbi:glycosyltransferase family 4 protein [Leptospira ilyithenensis]|uniref:Glycosyltransferase family 1 protein n=1 Tax=Leptospira ilyithenensis TaxID=2484901 RepID=A0A4V6QMU7_9LEPT|nr:glycosyltransferase family 1 protein [Leptospira ilyithenensis]TGN14589.1 glycosyltransferase family 1 protein [Leptospira ilyithenensis]
MNLGIDARPLAYGITGNSRYLAEVLRIIVKRNSKVHFYLFSNKPVHPVFNDILNFPNVKTIYESKSYPGPIYLNFILPKRIKEHNMDRFWGTLQMLPIRKLPIPGFVNYHDLNFISAPETMAKWNFWQHKLLSKYTLKNADKIFCLSKNTKNEISSYMPEAANKCLVVYPGVSKRNFKTKKGLLPKSFFLTVGTLEPRKNIKRLIDAFLKFKETNPKDKHSLLILGRKGWGEEGDKLFQTLTDGSLEKYQIQFMENPSDDVLGQAINECKAFFFPSHHEGFGLPLLEAMIEDKRCVASDIPVFREILSDSSDLYVPSSSPEGWTNAFQLFSNLKMGSRSPKFSKTKWSWDHTAKLLEEVLLK